MTSLITIFFFFSSRRRHTRLTCDWSSDVCSSDLLQAARIGAVGVSGDAGLERHLAPGLPAVLPEEVGDAADRVGRAAAQIDDAVVVEIDREAPRAARHELRDADRSGVGDRKSTR